MVPVVGLRIAYQINNKISSPCPSELAISLRSCQPMEKDAPPPVLSPYLVFLFINWWCFASPRCGHRVTRTRGVVFEGDEFFIAITFGITDTDLFIDISKWGAHFDIDPPAQHAFIVWAGRSFEEWAANNITVLWMEVIVHPIYRKWRFANDHIGELSGRSLMDYVGWAPGASSTLQW